MCRTARLEGSAIIGRYGWSLKQEPTYPRPMAVAKISITIDAGDPRLLADFWSTALGYVEADPPTGWSTWEAWLSDHNVPESDWNDGAALEDPLGHGPSISILKVPEAKTVKNRLHLDLHVSGGRHVDSEIRSSRIQSTVSSLIAMGATVVAQYADGARLDHVVLADPEGNEFCVV